MHHSPGSLIPGLSQVLSILVVLLGLSLSGTAAGQQQPTVRSELSAPTITRDETVMLTIRAVGIDAELDASALDADFDVVGRSSSREVRTITSANNQITNISIVTWTLELMPRDTGVFTIPAVKVGNLQTQLLTLTVNEIPQGAKRDIFVEASVDESEPYVQSQVVMTVNVFQAIQIVDGGLEPGIVDDVLIERLGDDTRSVQVRDGREYTVTTRRYALFAQKSGQLQIPPVTLRVTVPAEPGQVRGFFAPTRKLTRRSEMITLDVKSRPPGGSQWWLPASAVTLTSQWSHDINNAKIDTPLTRMIRLQVMGVLDTQLPDIAIPAVEGVSLYAEEPLRDMVVGEQGLLAEQRINWALIPQRAGQVTIPAVELEWFNTRTGQYELAVLAEETITIEAPIATATQNPSGLGNEGQTLALTDQPAGMADQSGAGNRQGVLPGQSGDLTVNRAKDLRDSSVLDNEQFGAGDQALTDTRNGGVPDGDVIDQLSGLSPVDLSQRVADLESDLLDWRRIAWVALVLWLITAMLLLWRWWGAAATGGASGARLGVAKVRQLAEQGRHSLAPMASVSKACQQTDLRELKGALLEWASRQWPQDPPRTLQALASRLPVGQANSTLRMLDAALYSQAAGNDDVSARRPADETGKDASLKGFGKRVVLSDDSLRHLPDDLRQALTGSEVDRQLTTGPMPDHAGKGQKGSRLLPDL